MGQQPKQVRLDAIIGVKTSYSLRLNAAATAIPSQRRNNLADVLSLGIKAAPVHLHHSTRTVCFFFSFFFLQKHLTNHFAADVIFRRIRVSPREPYMQVYHVPQSVRSPPFFFYFTSR